ncbi:Cytochrome P450 [Streptoalloteichus tenebrarius]|uniref:Cytochrome P450 n=1 Tax=Streptoalloteichus tenebrarius (strain ATCC 17920 / DSM 40477 / JCM 4838 / CBS 697.72 / NBRC 16177 / NCIMB 11028 / NRRL B-12390 / A12253. 1 / ISP 5477) TaxID=1933 RepID=A0ABT1HQ34_STRSD|nr:cytochrome P450 [Streptoalloteichus tenebrarius]MCP2257626.1 Cytochrome P450 [Streptoalloteichus tenebrarius]BFE98585.1 cytochrome P450 [Streptoalloteichus tenebrarius]
MSELTELTELARQVVDPDTYLRGVPHDALTALRDQAPVLRFPEPAVDSWPAGPGFWAVLRHAEARTVLRTPRVFSSHAGATQIRDPATPADLAYVRRMMLNLDPPEHTRIRGLLTAAFTPRAVARLEERIHQRARRLVRAVSDRGECDFATEVAADLPLSTLADVFGIPESDRWLMYDWSNRVIGYQDHEYAVSAAFDPAGATPMARDALALRPQPDARGRMPDPRTRSGMPDLYAYAHELGEHKRRHPGEDVMSVLMRQVDAEGGRVDVEEFENLFWLFAVAGNETLRNGLPGGMVTLLTHPDALARLRADRDLLPTAVEEMLRWWTPVMHFRRTATQDVELGGVRVRAGEKVVVWFSSANRDERVFADPHTFDPARRPNDHLTFGYGPHFCLGAHLARVQMRALFTAVLDHWAEIEPAGEAVRLRSNFQNGIKHLPIRFTPR